MIAITYLAVCWLIVAFFFGKWEIPSFRLWKIEREREKRLETAKNRPKFAFLFRER